MSDQPLAVREERGALMRPVARPDDLITAHREVVEVVARVLERERDYGVIPGTQTKPVLLQAGAERLCIAFGLAPSFVTLSRTSDPNMAVEYNKKVWNNAHRGDKTYRFEPGRSFGYFEYEVRCDLVARATGEVVGSATATCSTMESKYVDRPRDCQNTVMKMAQKRAFVSAVKGALGLSDRFTVDLDDFADQPVEATPAPAPAPVREPEPEVCPWEDFAALRASKDLDHFADERRAFLSGLTPATWRKVPAVKRQTAMALLDGAPTVKAAEPLAPVLFEVFDAARLECSPDKIGDEMAREVVLGADAETWAAELPAMQAAVMAAIKGATNG